MRLDKIVELFSKVQGIIHLCGTTEDIYKSVKAVNPDTEIKSEGEKFSIAKGVNVALIGEGLLTEGKTADIMKLTPKYSVQPNIREYHSP